MYEDLHARLQLKHVVVGPTQQQVVVGPNMNGVRAIAFLHFFSRPSTITFCPFGGEGVRDDRTLLDLGEKLLHDH